MIFLRNNDPSTFGFYSRQLKKKLSFTNRVQVFHSNA